MKRYSQKPSSIDSVSIETTILRLLEETMQDIYDCVSLLTNGHYSAMFKQEHSRDLATLQALLRADCQTLVTKALPGLGDWLDSLLKGRLAVVPLNFHRQTCGLAGYVVSSNHFMVNDRDPILVFDGDPDTSEGLFLASLAECADSAIVKRSWNLDPRWYTNSVCDGSYEFDKDAREQVRQYVELPQFLRCVWPILLYDVCRPWGESSTDSMKAGETVHAQAVSGAGIHLTYKEGFHEYTTAIGVLTRCLRTFCYMFYKLRTKWTQDQEERKLSGFISVDAELRAQTIFPMSIIMDFAREYGMAALGGVIIDPFIKRELSNLKRQRNRFLLRPLTDIRHCFAVHPTEVIANSGSRTEMSRVLQGIFGARAASTHRKDIA